MIEIKAKLVRADAAIYATGERVECLIEFVHKVGENVENVNNDENLAWASAQLHCYRKTSFSVSSQGKSLDLSEMIGKTALDAVTQAPGDIIITTKPKILFCDLKLKVNESKIYFFSEFVPRNGPPTYKGHDIKLTIATQRVKSKVQTLAVPIRVLPIPPIARPDELPITVETNDELAPTNPFLEKREVSELETSWHHLKNVIARRAPKFYRISNKRGFVGRFCLFKPAYKLGEDIVGSLDFANSSVVYNSRDLNDSFYLNSLDAASVASEVAANNLHKFSTSGSNNNNKEDLCGEQAGEVTTQVTSHQVCYAMLQTQVVVPIPLHVTPSFRTDLVDVRWRLHFEFVTSTMMNFGKENPVEGELQSPSKIPVETMMWNLPISIYSANPLQIYSPSQAHSLLIK
uniref:Arrestin C-terminal-like domain-containing protein n=1 Tax=Glossina pallidipes TaxID=7398 RepID=A0A1A9ZY47_GLOPL